MSQAIELLGDFEVNANQETFRLLFGEIKGIEMFTQFRVSHLFSMISFFYSLKREDKKRLIEFICSERVPPWRVNQWVQHMSEKVTT